MHSHWYIISYVAIAMKSKATLHPQAKLRRHGSGELWCSFTVLLKARRSETELKKYKQGDNVYLRVEDRHNSIFGFPHVLPPSTHLDVGICTDSKDKNFSSFTGVRHNHDPQEPNRFPFKHDTAVMSMAVASAGSSTTVGGEEGCSSAVISHRRINTSNIHRKANLHVCTLDSQTGFSHRK